MRRCAACNQEPTLGEMLDDPIVGLLMARDGVTRPDVENVMGNVTIPRSAGEGHAADRTCACRE